MESISHVLEGKKQKEKPARKSSKVLKKLKSTVKTHHSKLQPIKEVNKLTKIITEPRN